MNKSSKADEKDKRDEETCNTKILIDSNILSISDASYFDIPEAGPVAINPSNEEEIECPTNNLYV
ncbi:MAG: hypothetical protein GY821_14525 [Gammaproteobacteria bacterium]|nr:hypothetical protein [Gammaproteobacteria bacterium]